MKHYRSKEMQLGYIVGSFEPSAVYTDSVEIAVKQYKKGSLDAGYYRKTDIELILVLTGEIEVDLKRYKSGDILVYEPGEVINLFAVRNSKLLIVRFPGTKGDINRRNWKNFQELNEYYTFFLNRMIDLTETAAGKNELLRIEERPHEIDFKDITVVIQGYADKNTVYSAESVRKYLPGAKIVLSTWKDCDITGIDADEIVLNDDVGCVPCGLWEERPVDNNGNRQIVSTKAGLNRVTTKYALKLRSDLVLLGNDFLKYYFLYPRREEEYKIFRERLVIGELFSRHNWVYHRNGHRYDVPKPFHPSDWSIFGATEDLHRLYDPVRLIPENEMKDYVCKYPERVERYDYKYSWRYATEQHIFLACVREKYPNLQFEDWTDWSEENIRLSEQLIKNNFIVLNFARNKILNTKYAVACFGNNSYRHSEKKLIVYQEMEQYRDE